MTQKHVVMSTKFWKNSKLKFVFFFRLSYFQAFVDFYSYLKHLNIKATSKIRDFVIQKIYQLRKPMANYQIIQNSLLKCRFFYEFLLSNERQISKEIRDEYINTCWYLPFCMASFIKFTNFLRLKFFGDFIFQNPSKNGKKFTFF